MKFRYLLTSCLSVSACLVSTAYAQTEEADSVDGDSETPPAADTPVAEPPPATAEVAEPETEAFAPVPEPAPAAAEIPEEQAGPTIDFALFADTYVSYNSAKPGTPVPYHRAYDNNTPHDPVTGYPVDAAGEPTGLVSRNGFGLSFVGLDASFNTGIVGVTALLRFGPSVPIYYGTDTSIAGLDSFLGGYVTITPLESLIIDAGYFGTIYGAEVAESWLNINYSRGGLYYAMQPFYHFGVKAKYTFNDYFNATVLIANGANNIVDENDSPAFGLQLGLTNIGDVFGLSVGGFYETGADSAWGIESFFDVVATLAIGDFSAIANFDYNINRGADGAPDTSYYGLMGAAAYSFTPKVGIGLRGEYLMDVDSDIWTAGLKNVSLATVTGTLDLKLVDHLIIRPEFRFETSSEDIFTKRSGSPSNAWWTAMIGLVATSFK